MNQQFIAGDPTLRKRSYLSHFVVTSKMAHFHELAGWESFRQWLFKTRMTFYGMDLELPWWFGLSSWHYAIYGAVLLLVEPQWVRKSFFPYRVFALQMILLQGEL